MEEEQQLWYVPSKITFQFVRDPTSRSIGNY